MEIELLNELPLLEGEPLRVRITFTNNMKRPFKYLVGRGGVGPPRPILFWFTAENEKTPMRAESASVGGPYLAERYVRVMPPGTTRQWETTLVGKYASDLEGARRYEIVATFKGYPRRFDLWEGKLASNPLHVVPSAEPVTFSYRVRRTRESDWGTEYQEDAVFFVRAGWLAFSRHSPDTGQRGYFKKTTKVGDSRPYLVAEDREHNIHLLCEDERGERTYLHIGPLGKLLAQRDVDAATTLVRSAEGEIALRRYGGVPARSDRPPEDKGLRP